MRATKAVAQVKKQRGGRTALRWQLTLPLILHHIYDLRWVPMVSDFHNINKCNITNAGCRLINLIMKKLCRKWWQKKIQLRAMRNFWVLNTIFSCFALKRRFFSFPKVLLPWKIMLHSAKHGNCGCHSYEDEKLGVLNINKTGKLKKKIAISYECWTKTLKSNERF